MELKITYTDSFTGAQRTLTVPIPTVPALTTGPTSETVEYSLVMGGSEFPLTIGVPVPNRIAARFGASLSERR